MILGLGDWLKKYEDAKSKAWEDFFDQVYSIQEPEEVVVNMLNGMKRKYIFYGGRDMSYIRIPFHRSCISSIKGAR